MGWTANFNTSPSNRSWVLRKKGAPLTPAAPAMLGAACQHKQGQGTNLGSHGSHSRWVMVGEGSTIFFHHRNYVHFRDRYNIKNSCLPSVQAINCFKSGGFWVEISAAVFEVKKMLPKKKVQKHLWAFPALRFFFPEKNGVAVVARLTQRQSFAKWTRVI